MIFERKCNFRRPHLNKHLVTGYIYECRALGLKDEESVDLLAESLKQDLTSHHSVIAEVAPLLGFIVYRPLIVITETTGELCYKDDPKKGWFTNFKVIKIPTIIFPSKLEQEVLAMRGFYAHEFSHLALIGTAVDEAYRGCLSAGTPLRDLMTAYKKLDRAVDNYASNTGFGKEIRALREIYPIRK